MNPNIPTNKEMSSLKNRNRPNKSVDSDIIKDDKKSQKSDKTEQRKERIPKNKKRDTSLPPLKYKFLEQMKHQISIMESDSPHIFTR